MKKFFLACVAILSLGNARADEGMWIPSLIGKNYDEMVRLGLKLTKDDLYAINHSSLKDAIVQFGGGCTAEMISPSGLLITNHHCGYGSIAALSTVEHNYLDNGFWSHSMAEELPAEGLSVIYLQNIEDVTDEINHATRRSTGEKYQKKLNETIEKIEKRANQNGKLVANVKSYFNGNQYLLLTYKRYTDVRLVATPPKSLGKFGGDTDNWIWPRHTADFSMFRVYADSNNEPAAYNATNKPYRPKWYLPVSAKGVKDGDYTMIYGYPGRTNRYEISGGVELSINETNPDIVRLRGERLGIMKRHMDADKSVYLKLTSRYAGIANYWKYFIGQTEQLKRLHVVEEKRNNEAEFTRWAGNNKEYRGLVNRYNNIYNTYQPYARSATYYGEAFRASGLASIAAALEPLATAYEKNNTSADTISKYIKALEATRKSYLKIYDPATELDLLAFTARAYYQDVPKGQLPAIYDQVIFRKFNAGNMDSTFARYARYVTGNTFLIDSNLFKAFVAAPSLEKIQKDPAAEYAISFVRNYKKSIQPRYEAFNNKKAEYSKLYLKGLMEMNKGQLMYPDANSTMRITYGQVKGYYPKDGVYYEPFTTSKGILAKYKPNDDEFDAPKELIDMIRAKDYGRWMSPDSTVHTCFITTNDITGGNSGSPVINANGEWVGSAFDGNWEAMSGDIAFDKKYKRTIVVDARYVLWLIDKLGKAENLIEEMNVRY
ncbi:MAG: S46 family peptidase [Bacteroidetes bacterium]|nr:S46 family peptidase [Bacteroidota bacterium]